MQIVGDGSEGKGVAQGTSHVDRDLNPLQRAVAERTTSTRKLTMKDTGQERGRSANRLETPRHTHRYPTSKESNRRPPPKVAPASNIPDFRGHNKSGDCSVETSKQGIEVFAAEYSSPWG
ncbi:hypothetical protein FRB94_011983 [Tulasnella sp. JGI-2019a]|nr:hypothetical protein FRB94_011983 [Tulasnella sp. JGI-2019a]KAG9034521.1 hypothetical protein FRB95_013088 [Tulasnella sp. JGI-2019a]